MDSKLAPPEAAIKFDNFSKQILHIPLPFALDKMTYVIAAYFSA